MHPADQHPVPSSSETRSPSRSQSRASDLRWGDPKDIPNGGYAGPVCLNCHQNWWNTWCDDSPDGCYNCQAKNEICRRPQCENLHNCQNKNCKRAHASDQFVDTYPAPKNGPKRNSKKGDDHEEPPRKRQAGLAGAEYPGLRA
ncbi:hypothetical protein BU23DRAFT_560624 [Bimuria novae-zelandiae CBS 107.79]|uniref:Uncharacterized protein n=1 Tax=Bimuria novae-zelandiae CBS 107.79 TaxID=1447943 RepID=A0A6A5UMM2_9PLEO|nr:hypothetical protein BU23DRAFT_560624 [Bimuria novae-zelandiae CBS 107.79]